MTSRRSRSNQINQINQINQQTLTVLADRARDMDTKVESPRLKEPAKATPYLDPKHICAYDGPVKGCVCEVRNEDAGTVPEGAHLVQVRLLS